MKRFKKAVYLLLASVIIFSIMGCSKIPTADGGAVSMSQNTSSAEKKPVMLVVSFGSSYNETREATIGAVEKDLQQANPGYEVRRAFTSQTIIDILAKREKIETDNVDQAMQRIISDGVKKVVVQPTHVMPGKEYDDIISEIKPYAEKLESLKMGTPLLTEDADFDMLVNAIAEETKEYNSDSTAIVYMGHGTHHAANETYSKLQQKFFDAGYDNYFIGTVEAEPSLEDVMVLVKEKGVKKVVLLPLMVVAGDHACNDMAGDEDGSWKNEFQKAGYQVECVLKGLGEYDSVHQIFIEHAANAK